MKTKLRLWRYIAMVTVIIQDVGSSNPLRKEIQSKAEEGTLRKNNKGLKFSVKWTSRFRMGVQVL